MAPKKPNEEKPAELTSVKCCTNFILNADGKSLTGRRGKPLSVPQNIAEILTSKNLVVKI